MDGTFEFDLTADGSSRHGTLTEDFQSEDLQPGELGGEGLLLGLAGKELMLETIKCLSDKAGTVFVAVRGLRSTSSHQQKRRPAPGLTGTDRRRDSRRAGGAILSNAARLQ